MKFTHILTGAIVLTFMTGVAYGQENLLASTSDREVQIVDKNCWLDIFEDTGFDVDDPHIKLNGPFQSATLEDLAGMNWNNEIQSLIVGPSATVYAFKDRDLSGTEVAFLGNQRVSELGELDLSDELNP